MRLSIEPFEDQSGKGTGLDLELFDSGSWRLRQDAHVGARRDGGNEVAGERNPRDEAPRRGNVGDRGPRNAGFGSAPSGRLGLARPTVLAADGVSDRLFACVVDPITKLLLRTWLPTLRRSFMTFSVNRRANHRGVGSELVDRLVCTFSGGCCPIRAPTLARRASDGRGLSVACASG